MGVEAATASSILHEQRDQLRSWSLVVPKMTETEALSALRHDETSDHWRLRQQCYVSAVGLSSITVSGPPPALNHFAENLRLSQPSKKLVWLPIFAGYHAPHIHKTLDFARFLSLCAISDDALINFNPVKKLLSPLTGEPVEATNALDLFKAVVFDTLQAPLRLDRIADSCVRLIHDHRNLISTVNIYRIEPTSVADGLAAALRSRISATISIQNLIALDPKADEPRSSMPSDQVPLAIVGISGRFPGADSVEALWSVLEAGLDLHREVCK